jgi:hypothetical protein
MREGGDAWQPIELAWSAPTVVGSPGATAVLHATTLPRSESTERWKSLATRVPGLLGRPMQTVVEVCEGVPDSTVLMFAAAVNAALCAVISGFLCFRFKDFMESGAIVEVFLKSLAVLMVPFLALAASNLGLRKLAVQGSSRGIGFDALVAATVLLPVQTAGILFMILGLNEVSIGATVFSMVLSTLLVYAINSTDAPSSANRILFLTPLQYALAAYIAFFAYRQLLPNMGALFGQR